VNTLIDFDDAPIFAIPVMGGFGDVAVREGMLIEGPQGWGEFSPPAGYEDRDAVRWLTAAIEPGTVGWADPVRGRVPIAATVPAVDPGRAAAIVKGAVCRTAEVTVAERDGSLADDIARLEVVREALGPAGAIRCVANGSWDVDTAVSVINQLAKAAGGLEWVQQPCRTLEESAAVRRRVEVRIALGVSRSCARDARLTESADVAVLACGRLGGVRRALVVADACGLPCVVSSGLETSIGLSAGLALAGALPELPFACGLGTTSLLAGDLVAGPRSLIPVDGFLPVAPMPPPPDPELLHQYSVTDRQAADGWRERLRRVRTLL
jgi:o-succinylbenzoate synthase